MDRTSNEAAVDRAAREARGEALNLSLGVGPAGEHAAEIVRLATEFSKGCGNTKPFGKPPEHCEVCSRVFLKMV